MRALVAAEPGRIDLVDLPEPERARGHALIAPRRVGLCGTDLEIIDGAIDPAYVRRPVTLGHEWAGVVVDSDADGPPVGSHVVVEGIVACGECDECVAGNSNRCRTYDEIGFTRPGAAADLVSVPNDSVHVVSPEISFESAALVEPAAVVYRALDRAGPAPGAHILVVGDGTVGLLAAYLARQWRPGVVDVLGLRPAQAVLALAAGADSFRVEPTPDRYDLVLEAAGAPAAVEHAIAAVDRGGTVVLVGLAGTGVSARLPIDDVVNADVSIIGSFSYTRTAWRAVVDHLNAGRIDLGFLVTDRYPLDRWEAAIDRLRRSDGVRGKVMLDLDPA